MKITTNRSVALNYLYRKQTATRPSRNENNKTANNLVLTYKKPPCVYFNNLSTSAMKRIRFVESFTTTKFNVNDT